MDIAIVGRHTRVSDEMRERITSKMEKISALAPKATRVEVHVVHERNPKLAADAERVEITLHDKGVIRAEASADDRVAALEQRANGHAPGSAQMRPRASSSSTCRRSFGPLRLEGPARVPIGGPMPTSSAVAVRACWSRMRMSRRNRLRRPIRPRCFRRRFDVEPALRQRPAIIAGAASGRPDISRL